MTCYHPSFPILFSIIFQKIVSGQVAQKQHREDVAKKFSIWRLYVWNLIDTHPKNPLKPFCTHRTRPVSTPFCDLDNDFKSQIKSLRHNTWIFAGASGKAEGKICSNTMLTGRKLVCGNSLEIEYYWEFMKLTVSAGAKRSGASLSAAL